MIHKVKYGYMEVVQESSLDGDRRPPDLMFKGAYDREFVVFFAPVSTTEGQRMAAAYDDYYAPFEAEHSNKEEQDEPAMS